MYIASLERFHQQQYGGGVDQRWTQLSAALATAKEMFLVPGDNACDTYTSSAQVQLKGEDIMDYYYRRHEDSPLKPTNKAPSREREVEKKLDQAMKDLLQFILVS